MAGRWPRGTCVGPPTQGNTGRAWIVFGDVIMATPVEPLARKYKQAAIGYLIYGIIYLVGAIYLARIGKGPGGAVWWYLLGGVMALGFPYLIWNRFRWVTRILTVLVFVRVIGLLRIAVRTGTDPVPLPWGGEVATSHGAIFFMIIAATTCALLARAGWQRSRLP